MTEKLMTEKCNSYSFFCHQFFCHLLLDRRGGHLLHGADQIGFVDLGRQFQRLVDHAVQVPVRQAF